MGAERQEVQIFHFFCCVQCVQEKIDPGIIRSRDDFRALRLPEVSDRRHQGAESRAVSNESGIILLQREPCLSVSVLLW